MAASARARLEKLDYHNIEVAFGDGFDIPPGAGDFDRIIVTAAMEKIPDNLLARLEPGGILILDLFNPDMGRLLDFRGHVVLDKQMHDPVTGHTITKYRSEQVDLGQQVIDVTYVMDEVNGEGALRRTIFPFALRYFYRFELELLLRYAGFELEAVYGSYDLEEFSGDSPKMIAVARQPC